eukprot:10126-Heterococcus_DN1.PRE.4
MLLVDLIAAVISVCIVTTVSSSGQCQMHPRVYSKFYSSSPSNRQHSNARICASVFEGRS